MRKQKYTPNETEINEISRLYDLDKSDAIELLKITGPNIDSVQGYFKSLKHSLIHHYSKVCLRCGRKLKSLQSRLDGYGTNCKKLLEKDLKINKIRLVNIKSLEAMNNAEQKTTETGN